MPQTRYKGDLDDLIPLAERQDGYFLASQATEQGVGHTVLSRLAEAGHIERLLWGVYRLTRWPPPKHADLWPIVLWGKTKGWPIVFSHRTALRLHDVSDINPSRIDITLPRHARFRGKLPRWTVVHYRDVPDAQVEQIESLPVTDLYRTLLDLIVDNIARGAVESVIYNDRLPRGLRKNDLSELRALYAIGPAVREFLIENAPPMKPKRPAP